MTRTASSRGTFLSLFALALLCAVLSGCSDGGLAFDGGPEEAEVSVVQTTDGDTVKIAPEVQGEDRVRLIGVDTPETNPERGPKPYGEEAVLFTRESIQDRDVTLEFDAGREDDYGRLLAYVRLPDGTMFNETLLREGYAQVAAFPPNTRYLGRFEEAQSEAREARRGLWSLPERELCRLRDRGNGIGGGCG